MNIGRTIAALLIVLISTSCATGGAPAVRLVVEENPLFDLNGTWKGTIHGIAGPHLRAPAMNYDLWITIEGERVQLWYFWEDRWVELWGGKGKFGIAKHKSNAVLFASNSKPQVECHWVETWALTVSQFEPGSLEAFWHRVVNNSGCTDFEGGQFGYGATGRLSRISSSSQKPEPIGTY